MNKKNPSTFIMIVWVPGSDWANFVPVQSGQLVVHFNFLTIHILKLRKVKMECI